MLRSSRLLLFLLLLLPSSAAAQQAEPAMQSMRQLYESVKGFIVSTAEQSPEEDFSFKPTADVRGLGQLVAHVADAQFMICSIGLGEANPNSTSIEQANLGKAELLEALGRSNEYCDRAYAQSQAALAAPANLFGQETTRYHALNLNVSHDFEHYGNLVTYVRLRGRVPASSQQQ